MAFELAKLASDPKDQAMVTLIIGEAVTKSFDDFPLQNRTITMKETRRRLEVCLKWFGELKASRFTNERAAEECGRALVAELRGETYKIPTSSIWMPSAWR